MANQEQDFQLCIAILELLVECDSPSPMYDSMKVVVEKLNGQGDAKGLRSVKRELIDSIESLKAEQKKEVVRKLCDKFGLQVRLEFEAAEATCREILQRGAIVSEDEYRIVAEMVNSESVDNASTADLRRLDDLLGEYESSNS